MSTQVVTRLEPSRPGFIVGVGRSGTTLLGSMLNRHPDVCVTPETHFFRLLREHPGGHAAFIRDWPASFYQLTGRMHRTHGWEPDPDTIVKALAGRRPNLREVFLTFGASIARERGKSLWIEKSPAHLREYRTIRESFPDAPMIHLVRDGRDVAGSLCRVKWASDSFVENLHRWRRELRPMADVAADDACVLELRYEDLLLAPERHLRDVCAFLGIDYRPAMLEPDGREGWLIEHGSSHKEAIRRPVDVARAFAWKSSLGPARRRVADVIAHGMLARWNYETERPSGVGRFLINFNPWYETYDSGLDQLLDILMNEAPAASGEFMSPAQILECDDCLYAVWGDREACDTTGHGWLDRWRQYDHLARLARHVRRRGLAVFWWHHGDVEWSRGRRSRLKSERLLASAARLILWPGPNTAEAAELLDVGEEIILDRNASRFADHVQAAVGRPLSRSR